MTGYCQLAKYHKVKAESEIYPVLVGNGCIKVCKVCRDKEKYKGVWLAKPKKWNMRKLGVNK